jgi:predicted ATPase/class 3 adenylate cyclase
MSAVSYRGASGPLPSGTVTFVFTDIEGSTQRWERDRAAMQDAVRRHDALMRAGIAEHQGHVFKTIGDAFCAAFGRPEDAIRATLAVQRAIAAEDFRAVDGLRVRAAIHTGTADERDGDYFGPAVNRVARLLAIGHGGQVLVSGAASNVVRGDLAADVVLRDLGEHRLKDLELPERVYQIVTPDLRDVFPPLRSLVTFANNLPVQLASFVGRETEIAEITSLLERRRLVTLTGSGGIGKTRISLQVAANLLDSSGDGVWFIELAPLGSGDYIPTTVAQALALTLAPEGDPVANLVRALKEKHSLLVFDNCEHLIEPAARVVAAILHGCPTVRVLATSRQGLGIEGEESYRLPSLEVPAAVALFVDRALRANKIFALTDENAPIVADICRRLDGIPLAIELAASRVQILSPRQLRDRLDERFRVLTGGNRDALPRQQTLRALIDWSHGLLDERERVLFRRLGIFVNGFTLEGAVAVGAGPGLDELDVFDLLASLVGKSLVLAEPDGDSLRYRLLESTRAYALEKLDAADERDPIARLHLRSLRDCFAELWQRRNRTAQVADLDGTLQTELEDVRSALDGALERSDLVDGGELLASFDTSWRDVGLEAEGMRRCAAYLALLPADQSRLRARLSIVLAFLRCLSGEKVRALELATEAVEHARASGDTLSAARALAEYAFSATFVHRFDDAEKALAQAEMIPETSAALRIRLLDVRALLSKFRGDLDTASRLLEQIRKEHRSLGNAHEEQFAALKLAEVEHARGRTPRSIEIVVEALPEARSSPDKSTLAWLLLNLAGYLAAVDDLPGAVAVAHESIGIRMSEPDHVHIACGIEHLALVFALRGDLARAATLEGYADGAFARHGFPREFTEWTTHDRLAALIREEFAPDDLARLTAEGAALSPDAAIAEALR